MAFRTILSGGMSVIFIDIQACIDVYEITHLCAPSDFVETSDRSQKVSLVLTIL
jgi:hypothetical protein